MELRSISMSLNALLDKVVKEKGGKIKEEIDGLSSFEKMFLNVFMPMKINIVAQAESASLTVQSDGSVRISVAESDPDITVTSDYKTLDELFTSENKKMLSQAESEGKIRFMPHNFKGKQAVSYIKEMFSS